MNAEAIVRLPHPSLADGERTFLDRIPIDFARAEAQHAAYRAAIAAAGVSVRVLPALDGFPDAVFVEDALLAFAEIVVLSRPGAVSRAGEPALFAPHVPDDRPCVALAAGRLDGGDVLVLGRQVFVGLSSRTDPTGIAALTDVLEPFGYAVTALALGRALHLKTAMTGLGDDTLVVSTGWAAAVPPGFRTVKAHPDEPFGANLLWLGDRALGQADAPRTLERVAAAGFAVTAIDVSEFAKAEAGLTCLSVLVPALSR